MATLLYLMIDETGVPDGCRSAGEEIMPVLDGSTEFGARALKHLEEDQIGWLTTVDAHGMPKPSPIWFLWDGATVLIYSQPNAPKVRNIERNPNVSLNMNTSADGEDVLVLEGTATLEPDVMSSADMAAYVRKYDASMAAINMTWEVVTRDFSMGIRFVPLRARGN